MTWRWFNMEKMPRNLQKNPQNTPRNKTLRYNPNKYAYAENYQLLIKKTEEDKWGYAISLQIDV